MAFGSSLYFVTYSTVYITAKFFLHITQLWVRAQV